ncbi:hypothetical protein [Almyronema epifaneia]|uniref:Uncharacterized protein n=1 Tax=Almyronema epifaneia S1 TaxID=2991925 RepID=A0ABW6IJF0_9CYAN
MGIKSDRWRLISIVSWLRTKDFVPVFLCDRTTKAVIGRSLLLVNSYQT